jgi:hypothetical protein
MRNTLRKDRPAIKMSCGKGKKGCNYEGEAKLITQIKIAA